MVADLDMTKETPAFAYAGSRPWHGLGVAVDKPMTVLEALVQGGQDYDVEKRPLFTSTSEFGPFNGERQLIEDHYATVRTDSEDVLGVVGKQYTVVQNREALSFFDPALGSGAAGIETVGALRGGRRTFMLARIPEVIEIAPGDPVERYLLFTNSHDGSSAINCLFTGTRVVCSNTLQIALQGAKSAVKIRHTKSAKARLEQAHELLAQSENYWTRVRAAFAYMSKRQVSKAEVDQFLDDLFPATVSAEGVEKVSTRRKGQRGQILEAFETSPGADLAKGTAWGLFNAVTYWIDHQRSLKSGSDRWEQSVTGSGVAVRQKAFNLASSLG